MSFIRKSILSFTNTFFPEKLANNGIFYNQLMGGLDSNPDWIDISNVGSVYECIPHVQTVINRKAAMFSNMRFIAVDVRSGEIATTKEAVETLKRLRQPNPLQSQQHWLIQLKIYEQLFGSSFSHKVQGKKGSLPLAIWNLPSPLMQVNLTGKIYNQTELDEIIKNYELSQSNGSKLEFPSEEIIHSIVPSIANPIKGECKIKALQKPISNIQGSLQFRNVLITQKGALGILSGDSKDQAGPMPLNQKTREQIEKQHREMYGIGDGQSKLLLSETPVKWTPLTFPTKDLMLFEEITQDFEMIIDSFGMNEHQFAKAEGSTFENLKEGDKLCYQNTIIPEANNFAQLMTDTLETEDKGFVLQASFEHVPVLQKSLTDKATATAQIVEAVVKLYGIGKTAEADELLKTINKK